MLFVDPALRIKREIVAMKDELADFLRKVKANRSLLSLGETATKSGIIEPILRLLDWDTSIASSEVVLEFVIDQGRVDYCLETNKTNRVFLEAKKPMEVLDSHQDQLLGYAFRQGVKLAILSNGITWAFYLPLSEGKWEHRRFYTVDILEQDSGEAASRLIEFLAKQNVTSGDAVKNAGRLLEDKRRKEIIAAGIPEAWNRIVSEPDSSLLNILSERTNKICGFQPTDDSLADFFRRNADRMLVSPEDEDPDSLPFLQIPVRAPVAREDIPIEDSDKVSANDLMLDIVRALQSLGGRAIKGEVEKAIQKKYERLFNLPYYQQPVAGAGLPRWQHNIAWAKEAAKKRELVKWPSESGHGVWELTPKGRSFKG